MPEIHIESEDTEYVAYLKGKVVATGDTQRQAGERAARKYPDAALFAERVRKTKGGSPDKWRRFYP